MSLPKRWNELNTEQQAKVESYINLLLAEQVELPIIQKPGREVVERQVGEGVYYQLEKVKCGKEKCKCAKGKAHGPYWYAYWRHNGKVKSKYIGKTLQKILPNNPTKTEEVLHKTVPQDAQKPLFHLGEVTPKMTIEKFKNSPVLQEMARDVEKVLG